MKVNNLILGLLVPTILGSCGTMGNMSNTAKGSLIGGGSGALLGATIGGIAGEGKGAAIGAAVGTAVGAGTGAIIGKRRDEINRQMAEAAAKAQQVEGAKVEQVTDTQNGIQTVKVTFESGILFVTGKSDLNNSAKASLSQFANQVVLPNAEMDVLIKGYTDNQGWSGCSHEESMRKNNELSQLRAQSVSIYLQQCGVSPSQIKEVSGWGESNPVADNSTMWGREQNRRVEVYMQASEKMLQEVENEEKLHQQEVNL